MNIVKCKHVHCSNEFEQINKKKLYCQRSCKQNASAARTGRYKRKKVGGKYFDIDKSVCVQCGFKPINICQMDVDHIDGNHKNNVTENLQVLCANCHRLKTFQNKEWGLKWRP